MSFEFIGIAKHHQSISCTSVNKLNICHTNAVELRLLKLINFVHKSMIFILFFFVENVIRDDKVFQHFQWSHFNYFKLE